MLVLRRMCERTCQVLCKLQSFWPSISRQSGRSVLFRSNHGWIGLVRFYTTRSEDSSEDMGSSSRQSHGVSNAEPDLVECCYCPFCSCLIECA